MTPVCTHIGRSCCIMDGKVITVPMRRRVRKRRLAQTPLSAGDEDDEIVSCSTCPPEKRKCSPSTPTSHVSIDIEHSDDESNDKTISDPGQTESTSSNKVEMSPLVLSPALFPYTTCCTCTGSGNMCARCLRTKATHRSSNMYKDTHNPSITQPVRFTKQDGTCTLKLSQFEGKPLSDPPRTITERLTHLLIQFARDKSQSRFEREEVVYVRDLLTMTKKQKKRLNLTQVSLRLTCEKIAFRCYLDETEPVFVINMTETFPNLLCMSKDSYLSGLAFPGPGGFNTNDPFEDLLTEEERTSLNSTYNEFDFLA